MRICGSDEVGTRRIQPTGKPGCLLECFARVIDFVLFISLISMLKTEASGLTTIKTLLPSKAFLASDPLFSDNHLY